MSPVVVVVVVAVAVVVDVAVVVAFVVVVAAVVVDVVVIVVVVVVVVSCVFVVFVWLCSSGLCATVLVYSCCTRVWTLRRTGGLWGNTFKRTWG